MDFYFKEIREREEKHQQRLKDFNNNKQKEERSLTHQFFKHNYNDKNKELFNILVRFSAAYKYRANKRGLFLCAKKNDLNTGVGKTLGMMVMSSIFEVKLRSMMKLTDRYENESASFLDQINNYTTYGSPHRRDLIVDDVGAETITNRYGKKEELFIKVVEERYNKYIQQNEITHFTSNLGKDELINRYGERVWSRLNQMCNIHEVSGFDQRFINPPCVIPTINKIANQTNVNPQIAHITMDSTILDSYENQQVIS